jgi:hypothetical protein
MDDYAKLADWDLSTRKANEAYIRRVIKPALGPLQVRKIRGPLLDLLYAQLRRCNDPGCTGKRFVEHRNVPTLSIVSASRRPAWQQVADTLRDAVNSGMLAAWWTLERGLRAAGSRLQTCRMPAACVQAVDGEDDQEHPQHPVGRLFHSGALGVDLLEPGGVREASDGDATTSARYCTRGRGQGDRREP